MATVPPAPMVTESFDDAEPEAHETSPSAPLRARRVTAPGVSYG